MEQAEHLPAVGSGELIVLLFLHVLLFLSLLNDLYPTSFLPFTFPAVSPIPEVEE